MKKRTNGDGSITKKRDKYMVQRTIGYDQDGKQLRKTRTAATLTETRAKYKLRLHDLRHAFATRLLRNGVNIKIIREMQMVKQSMR